MLDSIERVIRQNRWELSKIFDFDPAGTVYSRAEGLTGRAGMVGFAYNAVKQAMHSAEGGSHAAADLRDADARAGLCIASRL